MNRITSAVKATYNFFSGDAILLVATLVAFVVAWLLIHAAQAPNPLSAVVFVAIIVGGLVTTLGREVRGRPRHR